jgi:hypothetical protein
MHSPDEARIQPGKQGHTPGPWKVVKPGHGVPTKYRCVQIGSDERYTTLDLLPADAILIAAAPALLEAAKQALAVLGHLANTGVDLTGFAAEIRQINKAIAQAGGGAP